MATTKLSKEAAARKQERRAVRDKIRQMKRNPPPVNALDALLFWLSERNKRVNEPRHKGGAGK